jgi:Zn-dependent M32 family carboxypeptidase
VLEKIFDTQKRFAKYCAPEMHPYNYYLNKFEKGLDMEKCDRFFSALKDKLVPLIKRIGEAQQVSDASATQDFRSKAFKASQAKMKEYYKLALPMFEKLRTLDDGTDPARKVAWTSGLYNCYYILNMGKELAEIEKIINSGY